MARIRTISARPILDSRGGWTVEVRLALSDKRSVAASVPQGVSAGRHEADTVSAASAVRIIERTILPALRGKDVLRQADIDGEMIRLDGTRTKRRLGGNTILGVSIAAARAASLVRGIPLWKHLRATLALPAGSPKENIRHPRLFMNMIEGGVHAGTRLEFQEYLVIPRFRTHREAIFAGERFYHELGRHLSAHYGRSARNVGDEGGYTPNIKESTEPFAVLARIARKLKLASRIDFGLDAAATGVKVPHKKLTERYVRMAHAYPLIYLEDPFGEEDFLEFGLLREKLGKRVLVAGDDLTTTNLARMEKALANRSVNAVIIKPNQIGTITEALDAVRFARTHGWAVVASHRGGETNDDFIADFAYGIHADGLKLGAPARGERTAKYNRLLEIEREAR